MVVDEKYRKRVQHWANAEVPREFILNKALRVSAQMDPAQRAQLPACLQ